MLPRPHPGLAHPLQGQQFVERGAQRVHVRRSVLRLEEHALRRHVLDGAEGQLLGLGLPRFEVGPRAAEVQDLHRARAVEHHVAGLDVSVDHPQRTLSSLGRAVVRGIERGGDGHAHVERDRHGQHLALELEVADQDLEVDRVEVLHHDRGPAVDPSEVEDVDDVPVPQVPQQAGFVPHARRHLPVAGPLRVQQLHGDEA